MAGLPFLAAHRAHRVSRRRLTPVPRAAPLRALSLSAAFALLVTKLVVCRKALAATGGARPAAPPPAHGAGSVGLGMAFPSPPRSCVRARAAGSGASSDDDDDDEEELYTLWQAQGARSAPPTTRATRNASGESRAATAAAGVGPGQSHAPSPVPWLSAFAFTAPASRLSALTAPAARTVELQRERVQRRCAPPARPTLPLCLPCQPTLATSPPPLLFYSSTLLLFYSSTLLLFYIYLAPCHPSSSTVRVYLDISTSRDLALPSAQVHAPTPRAVPRPSRRFAAVSGPARKPMSPRRPPSPSALEELSTPSEPPSERTPSRDTMDGPSDEPSSEPLVGC